MVDHPLFPWENLQIVSAFPKQASVTWNVPDHGDPTAKSLDFFSLLAQYILPNQANALPVMIRGGGRDQDPKELVRKIKKRYPVIRKNCNFRILPS